jgi:hypothetical protein
MRTTPLAILLASFLAGCTRTPPDKPSDTAGSIADDADADGFSIAEGDCADDDSSRFPGAEEACNGADEDCDGQVDEGLTGELWSDADGDGWGDPSLPLAGCDPQSPAATRPGDCDDGAPAVNPDAVEACDGVDQDCDGQVDDTPIDGTPWFVDADGDGHGDDATARVACAGGASEVETGGDCDDTNPDASPEGVERCDEADNDCDGLVDEDVTRTAYVDMDGDGWGDPTLMEDGCVLPTGYAWDAGDCDDLDPGVSPGAVETCDGRDEDCDGTADDDVPDAPVWYTDADGDRVGLSGTGVRACDAPLRSASTDGDCDDTSPDVFPGQVEACNDVDDDCDGQIDEAGATGEMLWYEDADWDGFGDPTTVSLGCDPAPGVVAEGSDCDDTRSDVSPSGTEVCGGADEDCDGSVDEDAAGDATTWFWDGDADTHGDASTTTRACAAPLGYVAAADDCDDTRDDVSPSAAEVCGDVDEDCDGRTDESGALGEAAWYADRDGDSFGDPDTSTLACAAPSSTVADATDCDDTDAAAYPGAPESPEGSDQDCDGTIDEGTSAFDDDGDGYTEAAGDCDDTRVDTYPGAPEVWYDGIDQACDSGDDTDADGDGVSALSHGGSDCDDTRADVSPRLTEMCDDGIDNDCDGAVDAADPACPDAEIVITTDAMDVSLAALAGYPSAPVYLQVRVSAGVTLSASSPASAAFSTSGLPAGSLVELVNEGTIHGAGGDGACGGAGDGEDGGDAIRMTVDMAIDTSSGGIYGGGGGGGAGDDPSGGGGGAGGGRGCDGGGDASGGVGGHGGQRFGSLPGGDGALYDGTPGTGGRWGDPGTNGGGGSGGLAYGSPLGSCCAGPGGSGGGWGGGGGGGLSVDPGNPRNAGHGGDAGYAVRVVSGTLVWDGGRDTTHVKGEAR